jgi:glycosyltransferase involved in cell wall biosynthesis
MGGAERVILQLANSLKDSPFTLIITSFVQDWKSTNAFIEALKAQKTNTRTITMSKKYPTPWWNLIRNFFDLCHLIKAEKIQILHTHGYRSNIIGLLVSTLLRIPIVTTIHGWTAHTNSVKLYECLDRVILRFFDKVIVVSDDIKNNLLNSRFHTHKIEKIYNTIDCKIPKNEVSLDKTRKRFRLSRNGKLVGTIGRLSKEKGVHYLLKAGSEIIAKYPDVKILIIGEGPERQNLETLAKQLHISKNVIFCGFQENVTEFYPLIDIVVLPSVTEGLPIVLLEALAYSKPIVATRVGGIPEVITNDKTGILVEPQNPSQLAEGIIRVLENSEDANRMASEGRKLVEEHFNSKDLSKKIEKIYQEVLGLA